MKVNTDGVLLGALAPILPSDRTAIDIGTGTGTIALMLAQRYSDAGIPVQLTGIDIDGPSASEATANFNASPWSDRLNSLHCSLNEFSPSGKFDLIVSNPPFFDESLKNQDARVSEARHGISLSYKDILSFAESRLTSEGRVALILPADTEKGLLREARSHSLFVSSTIRVSATSDKAPARIVVTFTRNRYSSPMEKTISIQDSGAYTPEYLHLMRDFYLFA